MRDLPNRRVGRDGHDPFAQRSLTGLGNACPDGEADEACDPAATDRGHLRATGGKINAKVQSAAGPAAKVTSLTIDV